MISGEKPKKIITLHSHKQGGMQPKKIIHINLDFKKDVKLSIL